jgi:hydroxylamine reductase
MFCFQCEQTSKGTGCSDFAVCGKTESTAILQDLLVHAAKGIAQFSHRARLMGATDAELDRFLLEALFVTVTNVNFDDVAIEKTIRRGILLREQASTLYQKAARKAGKTVEEIHGPATWLPARTTEALVAQGEAVSSLTRRDRYGADIAGLLELLLYGLKGMAAYAEHALVLGHENLSVYAFIAEALFYLAEEIPSVEKLLALNLKCGEVNLLVMELLDTANTGAYGHPVPTPVRVEPLQGNAILVSGHDLKDLEKLLIQTEGKGINIYTHGEMLPAHGYPELKKFKHLAGNYGGAWQDQKDEFASFPGAILMTTNCIQEPQENYENRIFTSGLAAWWNQILRRSLVLSDSSSHLRNGCATIWSC